MSFYTGEPRDLLVNYRDANLFEPEKDNEIRLRIELFIDYFNAVNALSSSKKNFGIIAIYFTINNLPYQSQSKRNDIHLVMLVKRDKITSLKIPLDPVIRDLKILDQGFRVANYDGIITYSGYWL